MRVFAGNTNDPVTVADQIAILRQQFGVEELVLVGDRGMIKSKGKQALHDDGLRYISAGARQGGDGSRVFLSSKTGPLPFRPGAALTTRPSRSIEFLGKKIPRKDEVLPRCWKSMLHKLVFYTRF